MKQFLPFPGCDDMSFFHGRSKKFYLVCIIFGDTKKFSIAVFYILIGIRITVLYPQQGKIIHILTPSMAYLIISIPDFYKMISLIQLLIQPRLSQLPVSPEYNLPFPESEKHHILFPLLKVCINAILKGSQQIVRPCFRPM